MGEASSRRVGDSAGSSPFPTTQWTVVIESNSDRPEQARQALEKLCATYRDPIIRWFKRRTFDSTAEDHAQEFLAYLLSKNLLARVTKRSGRFRFFLFACLRFYLLEARRRGRGQQAEVPLLDKDIDGQAVASQDSQLDVDFALTIHRKVMDRLKPPRELIPYLFLKDTSIGWDEIAEPLQRTAGAVRKEVSRLRRGHWETFHREVAEIVTPDHRAEETRYLYELLFKHLPPEA